MSLYANGHKVAPIIKGGVTPSGTISITENGTHDVTNYASANVNVSGVATGDWSRPIAWGQYPLEFQQEKEKEDSQRTMEAIYLLYHYDAEAYGEISSFAGFKCTINGGYKVERGHMVGSTFIVDSTTSVASATFYTESFTSSMPEYILYRITPSVNGNTFSAFAFGHTDPTLNSVNQIMVEVYGRANIDLIKKLKTHDTMHIDVITYGTTSSASSWLNEMTALQKVECSDWDMSGCGSMQNMFYYATSLISLDFNDWDTSNVLSFNQMFNRANALRSIDCSGWDTSKVTDMFAVFFWCSNATKINCSGWDMTKVTNASQMFNGCTNLNTIDMSGCEINANANVSQMFNINSLVTLNAPIFNASVSFSTCTKLSHDSLMSIINNLATVSTTQTLTLGATNLAKLTSEEIAIATGKGWTVA